jgi:phenylalanyl-tRNA synthetase alpha chain
MLDTIQQHLGEIAAFNATTAEEVEQFRIKYLGRKGVLNDLFEGFKQVAPDQKKVLGQELNKLKNAVQERLDALQQATAQTAQTSEGFDWSRPTGAAPLGTRHPLSIVRREILDIFSRMGFTVADGPEIEDDWHVFSGLNFPPEHPARDMQDTFFIHKPTQEGEKEMVLRTHTSSVQVRAMETRKPPIRIVMPGRVYRNEAVSSRAHCQFHQIEGLYIDEGVSFADMKQTLQYFTQEFFGKAKIRLRPSYFPFTEPSAEIDIQFQSGPLAGRWLEVAGSGQVHPNVVRNMGLDPEKYIGFAFGMGPDRLTMLRYGVNDLRLFFDGDIRFLAQFN